MSDKKYDFIQPSILRTLIAQAQIDKVCSEQLGQFIVRIHDIVKKQISFFRKCRSDELEEAISWSCERWLTKGIAKIDLSKFDNPFAYFYRGSMLNMMNRVQQLRRKELRHIEYQNMLKEMLVETLPGMQNPDLSHLYD